MGLRISNVFMLTILGLSTIEAQGSLRSCPQQEFIAPCTCRTTAFGMHVVCIRVPTANDLSRIFSVLSDYEVGTLLLQETQLDTLENPSLMFRGLRVLILRLVDCTLPTSVRRVRGSQSLLDGLATSLRRIDILRCNLGQSGLATLGLAKLQYLVEVNVNHERLTTVKKSWFSLGNATRAQRQRLRTQLQALRMEQSGIANLEDGALSNLEGIVVLSLAKNSINSLQRNILCSPAETLQTLDLSSNALTDLSPDIFLAMPQLRKILLYNNNLRVISQETWLPVWSQLETLWINDNPVVCDSTVKWLIENQIPSSLEGSCSEPSRLEGTQLSSLSTSLLEGDNSPGDPIN